MTGLSEAEQSACSKGGGLECERPDTADRDGAVRGTVG